MIFPAIVSNKIFSGHQNYYRQIGTNIENPSPPESPGEMFEYLDQVFLPFHFQISRQIVAMGGRIGDEWLTHLYQSEHDERTEIEGRFLAIESDNLILLQFDDRYDPPYYIESIPLENIEFN